MGKVKDSSSVVKVSKRGKYHSTWNENDTILTFFCEKWGASNLVPTSTDNDNAVETIANYYIGSSDASLKQQMLNFRYLITNGHDGYDAVSRIQKKVYEKYDSLDKNDFKNVCFELMGSINTDEVYNNFIKVQVENEVISLALKNSKILKETDKKRIAYNDAKRLEQIEMGAYKLRKDPKKLVSLADYIKAHPEDKRFTQTV